MLQTAKNLLLVEPPKSLSLTGVKPAELRNLNAFYFLIYAFIGWAVEFVYCLLVDGELVNRGMLRGPYLPIYGFGALIIIAVIAPRCKTALSLFLVSALSCGSLEYFGSWYLETVFNVSLWDYSNTWMNLHGRVCLTNTFGFGLLAVIGIYVTQPFFNQFLKKIPLKLRPYLTTGIVLFVLIDFLLVAVPLQKIALAADQILILFS